MLALMMPGILCFLLLTRTSPLRKAIITMALALLINAWFIFVINSRDASGGWAGHFNQTLTRLLSVPDPVWDGTDRERSKHYGLDMMKELCFINSFIDAGVYEVNWGQRYLAEFLNFVPRSIWVGKPMIGIDYAEARGFGGSDYGAGVYATVSTGLIGQGVVNFGRVWGVLAAAFLMTAWATILARLWVQRDCLPRAALFLIGLALTFNMGRDITLLVLWPFVFAAIGVKVFETFFSSSIPLGSAQADSQRSAPKPILRY
jgi:hypothetical protein